MPARIADIAATVLKKAVSAECVSDRLQATEDILDFGAASVELNGQGHNTALMIALDEADHRGRVIWSPRCSCTARKTVKEI